MIRPPLHLGETMDTKLQVEKIFGEQTHCYVDPELKRIGEELVQAYETERELTRKYNGVKDQINRLERERTLRLAELAPTPLHTQHVTVRPNPEQLDTLETFMMAMEVGSLKMITNLYNIARTQKCHKTDWISPSGETLDGAFQRRRTELEQANADRA